MCTCIIGVCTSCLPANTEYRETFSPKAVRVIDILFVSIAHLILLYERCLRDANITALSLGSSSLKV